MLGTIGAKERIMKMDKIAMLCTFDLVLILNKKEQETSSLSLLNYDNKIVEMQIKSAISLVIFKIF